jgi:hypothetical protein
LNLGLGQHLAKGGHPAVEGTDGTASLNDCGPVGGSFGRSKAAIGEVGQRRLEPDPAARLPTPITSVAGGARPLEQLGPARGLRAGGRREQDAECGDPRHDPHRRQLMAT